LGSTRIRQKERGASCPVTGGKGQQGPKRSVKDVTRTHNGWGKLDQGGQEKHDLGRRHRLPGGGPPRRKFLRQSRAGRKVAVISLEEEQKQTAFGTGYHGVTLGGLRAGSGYRGRKAPGRKKEKGLELIEEKSTTDGSNNETKKKIDDRDHKKEDNSGVGDVSKEAGRIGRGSGGEFGNYC